MVETGQILETISGTGVNLMVIAVVVVFILFIIIGAVWFYITKVKKFKEFKVIIWEKDGFGQLTEKYDQAGIFVDRATGNKLLFLRRANVGLTPDNIPFLPTRGKQPVIYLLQTGLKNFRYLKPVVDDGLLTFTVGEEDVNWAVNSYERQKKMFSQSWLAEYLPFMILAFVCMVILILFVYLFKQFPLIKEMMVEMKEIAKAIAQAKAGTVVV